MAVPILLSSYSNFLPGDANSNREAAVEEAHREAALCEEGSSRQKLYHLQAACGDLPAQDCPLQHLHAPHVYVRTIFIPRGTVVIGKIHKHAHANILSAGRVRVFTEFEGELLLQGPLQMISAPGTKRAVLAETDVVWSTIHPTESVDLKQIEEEMIAKTYAEYEAFIAANTKELV